MMMMMGNRMHKYMLHDDTYIADKADTYSIELDHVADWAQTNNLKLNRAKCAEIIISDSRRKPQFNSPPTLHDNDQLGLGPWSHHNYHLSVSDHDHVWQCDNDNRSWYKRCNNIVSDEFIWIRI